MFYGVSHIIVPVTELERSVNIWREIIGFEESRRGEELSLIHI